jgi:hypothetical protein
VSKPGPHVFGDDRLGCWFIDAPGWFPDKLRDRLPKVKALGVTDAFLPTSATLVEKQLVRKADLFFALYEPPPHGRDANRYATDALDAVTRLAAGALELNVEGIPDASLAEYVRDVVRKIRALKPGLRLRINVVPFKGRYLPAQLFYDDRQLFVIAQCYLGNMDARVAEDEVLRDLLGYLPPEKCSLMYAAHCGIGYGRSKRVPSLPQIRWRGSIYSDDLLADGGYL